MKPLAYYNENDPRCAAWLRELIKRDLIAPGDVDERSIEDVRQGDVADYRQCHFFAGIGGWSYALRLAGWPDDKPVWTGSCPCQPFSAAGKGAGFSDERHLWPAFAHLIRFASPGVVFGEQVASKAGREWFAHVRADLEAMAYAATAFDLCAAGVRAPHIRQRLYFVADSGRRGVQSQRKPGICGSAPREMQSEEEQRERLRTELTDSGATSKLANTNGRDSGAEREQRSWQQRQQPQDGRADIELDDAMRSGFSSRLLPGPGEDKEARSRPSIADTCFWSDAEWLSCSDGKSRPVESGTFPLAYGVPERVVRLRGYGNAIVPQLAKVFIEAYLEART